MKLLFFKMKKKKEKKMNKDNNTNTLPICTHTQLHPIIHGRGTGGRQ